MYAILIADVFLVAGMKSEIIFGKLGIMPVAILLKSKDQSHGNEKHHLFRFVGN